MSDFGIAQVISQGLCVGCGACAVAEPRAFEMQHDGGQPRAKMTARSPNLLSSGDRVCPFSDYATKEDTLSLKYMPEEQRHDSLIGRYIGLYAAHLSEEHLRVDSSSGGLTSWVASELLRQSSVDGVIHVVPHRGGDGDGHLFETTISTLPSEVMSRRKSNYYATTFAEALTSIRGDGRRYAFVGVPCFVRAVRLLCEEDAVLRDQIRVCLGLVCGHLKSSYFAEALAWQVGVPPEELAGVDFRVKVPGRKANDYDFGARRRGADELLTSRTGGLVGGNWGHGMFQLNACNYCDDIFAETADIAFGDAWLPRYKEDSMGTNILVTRTKLMDDLVQEAWRNGRIMLEPLSAEEVRESQSGNERHRRIGLRVRLQDDIDAGLPVPTKRVSPGRERVDRRRIRLIRQRRKMTSMSHETFQRAKQRKDLNLFLGPMRREVRIYRAIEVGGVTRRAARKLVRLFRRLRVPNI